MPRFIAPALGASSFLALLVAGGAPGAAPPKPKVAPAAPNSAPPAEDKALRAFLKEQCYTCHDGDAQKGGLALDSLAFKLDDEANFAKWTRVFDRMKNGEMPPPSQPRPDARQLALHLDMLRKALRTENLKQQQQSGRVILRRLNRTEYENSVQDLLGIETALKHLLPEDTPQQGFDTVADGLRLSPLHIEKYLEAADVALDAAIRLMPAPDSKTQRFVFKEQPGVKKNFTDKNPTILELPDAAAIFGDASYLTKINMNFRESGRYRIRASAYGYQTPRPVVLAIYAGNYRQGAKKLLGYWDIPADKPREVEVIARVEEGDFIYPVPLDLTWPSDGKGVYNVGPKEFKGAGVAVQWFEVEGPLLESWPPPSVKKLFGDVPLNEVEAKKRRFINGKPRAYEFAPGDAKAAIKTAVERFAAKAFRRPLEAGEADDFVNLANASLDAGRSFEDALRVAFRGILAAPQFLMFDEKPGKLNDYALAARLSYFLWSAPPDDELLHLAAKNQLLQAATLRAQTERLLNHPKSAAFARNFVGQWLDLRNIDATTPDARLYPEYDDILKVSMVAESEAFFNEMLKNDLPVSNFINSDFVTINRRLAEHYGIEGVSGEELRRVALPENSPRGGVLTQAAVLKVTANGTVTSPVLRGAWVMKRLMGEIPPPPPPNVGAIEPDTRGATTVREQLAKHRTSPNCVSCHLKIDPPGFALESFDVIGGYRERYRSQDKGDRATAKILGRGVQYKLGPAVDCTGELLGGSKFSDVREFKKLMMAQQEQISRAVIGKLITYGTGEGVQFADRWAVEDIAKKAQSKNMGLRSVVHEIVQSPVFGSK